MHHLLTPFTSCGPYVSGQAFDDMLKQSASDPEGPMRPFRRNDFTPHDGLFDPGKRFLLEFVSEGRLAGVEYFASPDMTLDFDGLSLFHLTTGALRSALQARGFRVENSDYGIDCTDIGLASFHPDHEPGQDDLIPDSYAISLDR